MYIESVPNRDSPPAVLLRESYREDGKVCKRTLANLSCLADEVIEGLKVLLRGGVAVASVGEVFTVERSLPHGHVAAVLGSARAAGATSWFGSAPTELQPLLLAMVVARVLEPASKLATHRMLHDDTATSSLGRVLGVEQCSAGGPVPGAGLAARGAAGHRAAPGAAASGRCHAGAVRPDLDLADRALLRAGRARPFARWQAR